ncbi:MAG TPA: hypothetical protein VI585_28515 [Candidatus Binatia bacterium]
MINPTIKSLLFLVFAMFATTTTQTLAQEFVRAYWPQAPITSGKWTAPAVERVR